MQTGWRGQSVTKRMCSKIIPLGYAKLAGMLDLSRKTKIIATVGPATFPREMLEDLLAAGVNVFRFNFSHNDYERAEQAMRDLRAFSEKLKIHIALFIDLQGPKIRVGKFQNDRVTLRAGQEFTLTIADLVGDEQSFHDIQAAGQGCGSGAHYFVGRRAAASGSFAQR